MLSMNLMKERMYYNNSLSSFEYDPIYGYNIDVMYNDMSIQNEVEIAKLK